MDAFLIPLIHHWGGGIRPVRRKKGGGGLKGASISDFNGRDGAITSIEGQHPCLAYFLYMGINTARISLKIFPFSWPQKVARPHFCTIKCVLHSLEELHFHFSTVQCTHSATLKCAFLAAWYSLTICHSSSLTLRASPDWWEGGGPFCLFVYQGMKNSYCALFRAEVI